MLTREQITGLPDVMEKPGTFGILTIDLVPLKRQAILAIDLQAEVDRLKEQIAKIEKWAKSKEFLRCMGTDDAAGYMSAQDAVKKILREPPKEGEEE